MPNKYAEIDQWTEEEVALFKEMDDPFLYHEYNHDVSVNRELKRSLKKKKIKHKKKEKHKSLTVISEGDSWFNYKISVDIIDCLRLFHGYKIKNFASPGDTLENMIYGTQTNRNFERVTSQITIILERVKRERPDVFLFSGAGNDIAGEYFHTFLHHSDACLGVLKRGFAINTITVVFRKYYQDLIHFITNASPNTHIFTHGYGYARPTGEGVGILGVSFIGPWLLPVLGRKGINPHVEGRYAIEELIDLFNNMLQELDNEHENFHFVDLRYVIDDDDWRDELHLKSSAFRLVSDQFDLAIERVYSTD